MAKALCVKAVSSVLELGKEYPVVDIDILKNQITVVVEGIEYGFSETYLQIVDEIILTPDQRKLKLLEEHISWIRHRHQDGDAITESEEALMKNYNQIK